MKDIVDGGYVIIGSPDEVVEQIRHVATSLNVGHLMLLLQYGNMSKDTTKYNTRLFAEKVMPKVKDLFDGWEDRWWPKPMAKGRARRRPRLPATASRRSRRRDRTADRHRRDQRLSLPRLDQGQRSQARLSRRAGRIAALDPLPRPPGRDAHRDRAVAAGLSRRRTGHTVLDTHLDWILAVRQLLDKAGLAGATSSAPRSAAPSPRKWRRSFPAR